MRIIEVGPGTIPIPPRGFGAIERVIWELYRALTGAGHRVTIYNRPHIEPGKFPAGSIVHCHWPARARELRQFRIPYVYTSHSHIWQKTCMQAMRDADGLLALHKGMVPQDYVNPVQVVGNGVSDFWCNYGQERADVVVACANYSERKRLEWMHELIDLLPEPWTGVVIGPNVPKFLKMHPRITLYGARAIDGLRIIYNRAKVGFHPAKMEAFALVPLEMAACGLLTLVSNDVNVYEFPLSLNGFDTVEDAARIITEFGPFSKEDAARFSFLAHQVYSWDSVAMRVIEGLERIYD